MGRYSNQADQGERLAHLLNVVPDGRPGPKLEPRDGFSAASNLARSKISSAPITPELRSTTWQLDLASIVRRSSTTSTGQAFDARTLLSTPRRRPSHRALQGRPCPRDVGISLREGKR